MKTEEAAARLWQRVDETLPGLARSWYVTGSVADGTVGAASDLDLVTVTRDELSDAERETVRAITRRTTTEAGVELDLEMVEMSTLVRGVDPQLKLGGRLLHGEDLVAIAPLIPIEDWARERMHAAYYLMISVFGRRPIVREPLDYPLPYDPFYGYALRDVVLPDGHRVPSTRNLVRVSGWIATALLAWMKGRYVARKSECHMMYRSEFGDQWSGFVEQVYTRCRRDWEYLIPAGDAERKELRGMGEEMLRFERHFLSTYRRFLLGELAEGGDRTEHARWVMKQLPFDDGEVAAALAALER